MFATNLRILLLIFHLFLINGEDSEEEDWNYQDQSDWSLHFQYCNGTHESPIDIDSSKTKMNPNLRVIFNNYGQEYNETTAQNNGHTVRVFLQPNTENQIPYISGEAVNNETFIFDSLHFHWGCYDFNGSEHSINGIKRSAECHLLHWNLNYGNVSNARDREDGLAVVAVFIETENKTDSGETHLSEHNTALTPIINSLPQIKGVGNSTQIEGPTILKAFLPEDTNIFYKYQGSLTTPPCSESATFIVCSEPIYMTSEQLSQFRLIDGQSQPLTHNSREQMPLNDRVVEVSNPSTNLNTIIV